MDKPITRANGQIVMGKNGVPTIFANRTHATARLEALKVEGYAGRVYQSPLSRRFYIVLN